MKIAFTILGLTVLTWFNAIAQVTVEVVMEQGEFLPSESVPAAVRITNRSGQRLHLGEEPNWLTFNVESADGFIVPKNSEVPVVQGFDLASSQVATKHVELQPHFGLTRPGRYRVIATVRIKDWDEAISSPAKDFFIISGAKIWAQDFGVPMRADATNRTPEVRRYTLEKANFLRKQLRMYVQVSDPSEARVYKVVSIGQTVSFGEPETQLDRSSDLHVLFQSGASFFTYAVVNPEGEVLTQEIYDYVKKHPRLVMSDDGIVTVAGGVRRMSDQEVPKVISPDQLPAPGQP